MLVLWQGLAEAALAFFTKKKKKKSLCAFLWEGGFCGVTCDKSISCSAAQALPCKHGDFCHLAIPEYLSTATSSKQALEMMLSY